MQTNENNGGLLPNRTADLFRVNGENRKQLAGPTNKTNKLANQGVCHPSVTEHKNGGSVSDCVPKKKLSRAEKIRAVMEDGGWSRAEAAVLVDEGFGSL